MNDIGGKSLTIKSSEKKMATKSKIAAKLKILSSLNKYTSCNTEWKSILGIMQ